MRTAKIINMLGNKFLGLMLLAFLTVPAVADEAIWQEVGPALSRDSQISSTLPSATAERTIADTSTRRYKVNAPALRAQLELVTEQVGPGSIEFIRLPMPDGSLAQFRIYESPVMEDELAQKYPGIRTFQLQGVDDPLASGRADITPAGFHAILHTSQGRLFIDPDRVFTKPDHYLARSANGQGLSGYSCRADEPDLPPQSSTLPVARLEARLENRFLQYKLAVSATDDYVDAVYNKADTRSPRQQAQAQIVTAINRVNEIYQRDVGIFFRLVGRNDELIEVSGEAGFSNDNPFALIDQNQVWIDDVLGSSSYDVGHVFSSGGGGLASLGSACQNGDKARGVSGITNPIGDPFYIDFVAHEIGHQFNAGHSFNGTAGLCASGRAGKSAYEPGSGSSIMAYAGICNVENLQDNSDASFHAGSISQINRFTARGGSCYKEIKATPANPNEPVVDALKNETIPALTAFVLDAEATDADADMLSYQWDQMDTGCSTDEVSFGSDNGSNPLFRSYLPQAASERHFPALGTQLLGLYDDAEVLPCQDRDLNFRVTVRDGFSGQDTADIKLSVSESGGRFRITNLDKPGTTIVNPNPIVVQWDVADTDRAPINCPRVDIELLTFNNAGYARYSIHPLRMNTPNNGRKAFRITPDTESHPRARIRVKCSNNVFYDISDVDFAISGTGAGSFDDNDFVTFFNNSGTTGGAAPACRRKVSCRSDSSNGTVVSDGGGGGGAFDGYWICLLGALLGWVRFRRKGAAAAPAARL